MTTARSIVIAGVGFMGSNIAREAHRVGAQFGLRAEDFVLCDRDPVRLEAFRPTAPAGMRFETDLDLALRGATVLMNATNSPLHLGVIERAVASGIRQIYCEKPLVLADQLAEARRLLANAVGGSGYVINASEALEKMRLLMAERGLFVLHVSGTWEKNRLLDERPNAGYEPDDFPHQEQVAFSLVRENQVIRSISLQSQIGTLPFALPGVQERANELDRSFPIDPSLHAGALFNLVTDRQQQVTLNLRGSFAGFEQNRRIDVLLGEGERPQYLARLDFDVNGQDILKLRDLKSRDAPPEWAFPAKTKLARLLTGFFELIFNGKKTPQLVTLPEALWLVEAGVAIQKSAESQTAVTLSEGW